MRTYVKEFEHMYSALSELEITAYHEAGHTVVTHALGKKIGCISLNLLHTQQGGLWYGESQYDPDKSTDAKWANCDLNRYMSYDKLPPPNPDDEYKKVRDDCTITCAGLVAEELLCEQLGRDKNIVQSEGSGEDKRKVEKLVQMFPFNEQEKELLNAEAHARGILSNPVCWSMVEHLVKELTSAILQGSIQKQQKGFSDWYVFTPLKHLYPIFARTLDSSQA